MFALWMFGSVLENLWGSKRFLTFYIICGLGAALIHLLFLNYEISGLMRDYNALVNQHAQGEISIGEFNRVTSYYNLKLNTATLGASGAVFGVLAAFVYLFPNTYIYLYFLVPIKAKWLGLGYFAFEVFYALKNSAGDNVARWAHIGGAIVGLILVLTWNKTNRKSFF